MNNFINWLSGKKTYIISVLMVLVGVVNYLSGDITLSQFLQSQDLILMLEGLGLGALRAGVFKSNVA